MCTITYVPDKENATHFMLTSNRDESVHRAATKPKFYQESLTQLYYPKDKKAGGSWLGISKRNRLITLMNGAFQKYDIQKTYGKSRGVVLKELLVAESVLEAIENYDFRRVAPFFSLLISWKESIQIYEVVWDGARIYLNQKDETLPEIWSSRMSYSPQQHRKKEQRFQNLLEQKDALTLEKLWSFHHEDGILIHRGDFKTTYISQFEHRSGFPDQFRFEDLISDRQYLEDIIWEEQQGVKSSQ